MTQGVAMLMSRLPPLSVSVPLNVSLRSSMLSTLRVNVTATGNRDFRIAASPSRSKVPVLIVVVAITSRRRIGRLPRTGIRAPGIRRRAVQAKNGAPQTMTSADEVNETVVVNSAGPGDVDDARDRAGRTSHGRVARGAPVQIQVPLGTVHNIAQRPTLVEGDRVPIADGHYAVEGVGQGPSITRSPAFHSTHDVPAPLVAVQVERGASRSRACRKVSVPPRSKWCRC